MGGHERLTGLEHAVVGDGQRPVVVVRAEELRGLPVPVHHRVQPGDFAGIRSDALDGSLALEGGKWVVHRGHRDPDRID